MAARQHVRVPWQWVDKLQSAKRVSTWRLAMTLLYEHWRIALLKKKGRVPKSENIRLSNILAKDAGLSRRSKSRSLDELEGLGLLEVTRRLRASPRIVLKHLEEKK